MKPQTDCLVCSEVITNPVCPDCLGKEVEEWLMDKDPNMAKKFKRITNSQNVGYGMTSCIVCGNYMDICTHCYCKDTEDWLRDYSNELGEDFVFSFNFELKRFP